MPKKKDKPDSSRTDSVRSAVDQAFQAGQAQFSRERAQEVVEELAQAAGRVRDVIDDFRPTTGEELRELRERIERIEARLASIEQAPKPRAAAAPRAKTSRSTTSPRRAAPTTARWPRGG